MQPDTRRKRSGGQGGRLLRSSLLLTVCALFLLVAFPATFVVMSGGQLSGWGGAQGPPGGSSASGRGDDALARHYHESMMKGTRNAPPVHSHAATAEAVPVVLSAPHEGSKAEESAGADTTLHSSREAVTHSHSLSAVAVAGEGLPSALDERGGEQPAAAATATAPATVADCSWATANLSLAGGGEMLVVESLHRASSRSGGSDETGSKHIPNVIRKDWARPRPSWVRGPRREDKGLSGLFRTLVSCSMLHEDHVPDRTVAPSRRCDGLSMVMHRVTGLSFVTLLEVAAWINMELHPDLSSSTALPPRAGEPGAAAAAAAAGAGEGSNSGTDGAVMTLEAPPNEFFARFLRRRASFFEGVLSTVLGSPVREGVDVGLTVFQRALLPPNHDDAAAAGGPPPRQRWVRGLWEYHAWCAQNALSFALFLTSHRSHPAADAAVASTASTANNNVLSSLLQRVRVHGPPPPPPDAATDAAMRHPDGRGPGGAYERLRLGCVRYVVVDKLVGGGDGDDSPEAGPIGLAADRALSTQFHGVGDASHVAQLLHEVPQIVATHNATTTNTTGAAGQRSFLWGQAPHGGGCSHLVVVALYVLPRITSEAALAQERAESQAFVQRIHSAIGSQLSARASTACAEFEADGGICALPKEFSSHRGNLVAHPVFMPRSAIAAAQRARRRLLLPRLDASATAMPHAERVPLEVARDAVFGIAAHEGLFIPAAVFAAARAAHAIGSKRLPLHLRVTHVAVVPPSVGARQSLFFPTNAVRFLCTPEVRAAEGILLAPTVFQPPLPSLLPPADAARVLPSTILSVRAFDAVALVAAQTSEPDFVASDTADAAEKRQVAMRGNTMWRAVRGFFPSAWMNGVERGRARQPRAPLFRELLRELGLDAALYTAFDAATSEALQVAVEPVPVQISQDPRSPHGHWAAAAAHGHTPNLSSWFPVSIDGVGAEAAEALLARLAQDPTSLSA